MSVLYDVQGPRGRRRTAIASAVALLALAGLVALAVARLAAHGQFEGERWRPFTQWSVLRFLLEGLVVNARVAVIAMILSCTIGAVMAFGRLSRLWFVRTPATAYVQFFRAIPLLVLILFAAVGLPKYGIRFSLPAYLVIGLTVYNSAVIAEIVRAGILSLDRGQREAALTVGLTERQAMRHVVLPQAVRRMLPALVTQLVTIFKDTSLGFIIGVEELLRRSQLSGEFFPNTLLQAYFVAGVLFVAANVVLTRAARWLERRQQRRLGGTLPDTAANEELAVLQAGGRRR